MDVPDPAWKTNPDIVAEEMEREMFGYGSDYDDYVDYYEGEDIDEDYDEDYDEDWLRPYKKLALSDP